MGSLGIELVLRHVNSPGVLQLECWEGGNGGALGYDGERGEEWCLLESWMFHFSLFDDRKTIAAHGTASFLLFFFSISF